MLRVGLTGGIGSGKSTVAARLAEHGAVVVDADRIAREVVRPGTDGLAEVVAAFGPEMLAADGALNRAALAARVFGDDQARATLNAIIHPRVGARTVESIAAAPPESVVVHDIPLLVEGGLAPAYHLVLVVDAPEELRLRRLVQKRGMTEADVRARIAAQASDGQRRVSADVWLDNSGSPDQVLAEVDALWADRLVPFEANVRLGRRLASHHPLLAPADPTWPAQADRLIARIRLAAGDRALRVDHIGSTSVPGLAAQDVLDLQLAVPSLADAEELAGELTGVGFLPMPDITRDRPTPADPDPEHWRKRFHQGMDPGRPASLHVRVLGSPGWRYALLFRDWLRAESAPRAEYQAHKLRLAEECAIDPTTERYASAKEPWFDAALPRAEEWARRGRWSPPS